MPDSAAAEQQPNFTWTLQFPWQKLNSIVSYLTFGAAGAAAGEYVCLAATTCYPPLWWLSVGGGFFAGAGLNRLTRSDWGKPFYDLRDQQGSLIKNIETNVTALLEALDIPHNKQFIQSMFIKHMLELYLGYAINETNLSRTTLPKLRDSVTRLIELDTFINLVIKEVSRLNESTDRDVATQREQYFSHFTALWRLEDDDEIRAKIGERLAQLETKEVDRTTQLTS